MCAYACDIQGNTRRKIRIPEAAPPEYAAVENESGGRVRPLGPYGLTVTGVTAASSGTHTLVQEAGVQPGAL